MNGEIQIDERYIGGFFDGEGSAFIVPIKRKLKTGIFWRFRPHIKIPQKQRKVLDMIKDRLKVGYVSELKRKKSGVIGYVYNITSFKEAEVFCRKIIPYTIIKRQVLMALMDFINICKSTKSRNMPLTREEVIKILKIRTQIHMLNTKTKKSSARLKITNEEILRSLTSINIKEWCEERRKNLIKSVSYSDKVRRSVLNEIQSGKSFLELSRKYGISWHTIKRWADKAGIKSKYSHLKEEQKREILRLIKNGMSYRAVAKKMGVSIGTISSINKEKKSNVSSARR